MCQKIAVSPIGTAKISLKVRIYKTCAARGQVIISVAANNQCTITDEQETLQGIKEKFNKHV